MASTTSPANPFQSRKTLKTAHGEYTYYSLEALKQQRVGHVDKLPVSIKVLLEAMLRNVDGFIVTDDDVSGLANYNPKSATKEELPFMPARVVLQDFTGVPCVVDLAAMRDAMKALGGDPNLINPLVPCDLVIDHSVQVDAYNSGSALTINGEHEFERDDSLVVRGGKITLHTHFIPIRIFAVRRDDVDDVPLCTRHVLRRHMPTAPAGAHLVVAVEKEPRRPCRV